MVKKSPSSTQRKYVVVMYATFAVLCEGLVNVGSSGND